MLLIYLARNNLLNNEKMTEMMFVEDRMIWELTRLAVNAFENFSCHKSLNF